MTHIYLFLGAHVSESDFERLKSKIDSIKEQLLKKEKLVSIIEYGGPPYLPTWSISEEILFSDEKFKEYFFGQRKLIAEDLNFFIKNRKSQSNVITSPFHALNLNLLLDLGAELVLEDVPFDEYKKIVRDCYKFFRVDVVKIIIERVKKGDFSEPHFDYEKIQKPMTDMRDGFIIRQIKSLSYQNPEVSFVIVRGDWHKEVVELLKKENFNVIPISY